MTPEYKSFIEGKSLRHKPSGFKTVPELHTSLFEFQNSIVSWALRGGRRLLGEDCGLGKTFQELEWSKHVVNETKKPVILFCPLAVAPQTLLESQRFGYENVKIVEDASQVINGINITNYHKLHKFDCSVFGGVVLDESDILASFMGKTKQALCHEFRNTPYRLCASATWAPNDHMEIGNHAEFLGIMPSNEMLARWFINDPAHVGKYRLKGHAEKDFWNWVSSWACCIRKPSDIGFSDEGFELPPLNLIEHCVGVETTMESIGAEKLSATTLHDEFRRTADARADVVAELTNKSNDFWTIWVNSDYEAEAVMKRVKGAVEVSGKMKDSVKEQRLNDFSRGKIQKLVTKSKIAGFGMNWQHCNNFCNFNSYSFKAYYQLMRRHYRFGQKRTVNGHIIFAETEGDVLATIKRKQADQDRMHSEMCIAMRDTWDLENRQRRLGNYNPTVPMTIPNWVHSKGQKTA